MSKHPLQFKAVLSLEHDNNVYDDNNVSQLRLRMSSLRDIMTGFVPAIPIHMQMFM